MQNKSYDVWFQGGVFGDSQSNGEPYWFQK